MAKHFLAPPTWPPLPAGRARARCALARFFRRRPTVPPAPPRTPVGV